MLNHILGGLLGGLFTGAVLTVLNLTLSHWTWSRISVTSGIVGIALLLSLPQLAPRHGVGSQWQVPRSRRLAGLPFSGVMLLWGAILGAGALTVIPHAVVLLLVAFSIAVGNPLATLLMAATYGTARAGFAAINARAYLDQMEPLSRIEDVRHKLSIYGPLVALILGAVAIGSSLW